MGKKLHFIPFRLDALKRASQPANATPAADRYFFRMGRAMHTAMLRHVSSTVTIVRLLKLLSKLPDGHPIMSAARDVAEDTSVTVSVNGYAILRPAIGTSATVKHRWYAEEKGMVVPG